MTWSALGGGCTPDEGELYRRLLPGVVTVVMVQGLAPPGPPIGTTPATADDPVTAQSPAAEPGADGEARPRQAWITAGMGSGVLLDPAGHVATAAHVLAGADRIGVVFAGGLRSRAQIVGLDPLTDLAVLQVQQVPFTARPLALDDGDALQVGDPLLVIGNPDGLPATLTGGRVSGLHRRDAAEMRVFQDYLQTDAALFPGCSGGPVIDRRGRVVGLVTEIDRERRGVGFAIPAHRARPILDRLVRDHRVVRGWVGSTAKDLDAALERQLGLRPGVGAEIWRTLPGHPAARAGLLPGDVVFEADGRPVSGRRDLAWAVSLVQPSRTIQLKVLRRGKTHTVRVPVAQRPEPPPEGGKNAF